MNESTKRTINLLVPWVVAAALSFTIAVSSFTAWKVYQCDATGDLLFKSAWSALSFISIETVQLVGLMYFVCALEFASDFFCGLWSGAKSGMLVGMIAGALIGGMRAVWPISMFCACLGGMIEGIVRFRRAWKQAYEPFRQN